MGWSDGWGLALCAGLTTSTGAQAQDAPSASIPSAPTTVDADPVATRVPDADTDVDPGDVVVYGRATRLIGIAQSSSQGTIGYKDFENKPLSRVGELVENVPGLIATQHSGPGKANQYFLRGFNLDHGTDLAGFIDGVPINLRGHGHGQGYLDLNFLIPELIEKIDFRKGPYFADVGDFSAAATISFKTADTLPAPIVEGEVGSFGFYRGLVAGSTGLGKGDLLIGIDGQVEHGAYIDDEKLGRVKGLVKYSQGTDDHGFNISFNGYRSTWRSTDQVPERAIESGLIGLYGNIDHYLGGETTRLQLATQAHFDNTEVSAFGLYYKFRLTSNFTYFLDDPVNGDEFQQRDQRGVFGGTVKHSIPTRMFGRPVTFVVGADARYDRIDKVGLFHSEFGQIIGTRRLDKVDEYGGALYGDAAMAITDRLRATVGLRGDFLGYNVRSDDQRNSGRGHDQIGLPKATVAWKALDHLELYADYGQSYHSNDVRGAVIRFDPGTDNAAERVGALQRAIGYEAGARVEFGRFNATLTGFHLALDSELVFQGDTGSTQAQGATRRYGGEGSLFWRPRDWVTIDASAAFTHARFKDAPGAEYIPNSQGEVIAGGATFAVTKTIALTARVRHFGTSPLTEDNSARSKPTTIVNSGAYWKVGRLKLALDVLNLLDSKDSDITYFYRSRLQGEPLEGVDDYHVHPIERRQFRGSLSYTF